MKRILIVAGCWLCAWGQTQTVPDDTAKLESGRKFVAGLRLDASEDGSIFDSTGLDSSAGLMNVVVQHGQRPDATAADWQALHRATEGLIELYVHSGDLYKASVYASFQDTFYRNLENDYKLALAASRTSLELQERSGVQSSLYLAHSAIARNLSKLGQPEQAAAELRQARSQITERESPASANLWHDLVLAEIAAGQLDSARAEAKAFLDVSHSAPPLFQARALLSRSDVEIAAGDFLNGLETVKHARELVTDKAGRQDFDLEALNTMMGCVLAAMRTLSYDESLLLANRLDQDFPGMLFQVAPFARAAVKVRRRLAGDIEGVLAEDTRTLGEQRAAGNVDGQIETLRSLAVTYAAFHAIPQQIQLLEQALFLEENRPGITQRATYPDLYSFYRTLASLGDAYLDNHEIGNARRAFARVTKEVDSIQNERLRKQLMSLYAECQRGKARVSAADDDMDTARELMEAELKRSPGDAAALLQYARLERQANGNPARTRSLYGLAIQAIKADKNSHLEIAARLEYARYLTVEPVSRTPDALVQAKAEIATVEVDAASIQYVDAQWRLHFIQGLIAEREKDPASAIDHYRIAVGRLDAIRAGLTGDERRQSLMDDGTTQELYQRLVGLLAASNQERDAWEFLERGKARSFLELLQGRRFRAGASEAEQPKIASLREIENKITGLRSQLTPGYANVLRGAGIQPAVLEAQMRKLEAQFALERQQAGLGATRSGNALALKPPSLENIRKLLPPRTALLEYALLNDAIAAFVITRADSVHRVWPAQSPDLRRKIVAFRGMLANPNSGEAINTAAAEIAQLVIAPIISAIPGDIDQLLIVPAGHLNYIPFQVLLLPDGRQLLDRFAISYLPSASTLEFLHDDRKPSGSLFLGALGSVPVDGMAPLPGTLVETEAIARIEPGALRVWEAGFTHDRARTALLESDRVHFATHGILDERSPLFSALVTNPAPGQPSRLSLYEVTEMRVRARIVVLSACETGLGKLLLGDEISGLTRTFLSAGASTVISSLWKVSDDSTALLMRDFYRLSHEGRSPARAMQEAALEVRKQFPHPFFWAPFVVTGAR